MPCLFRVISLRRAQSLPAQIPGYCSVYSPPRRQYSSIPSNIEKLHIRHPNNQDKQTIPLFRLVTRTLLDQTMTPPTFSHKKVLVIYVLGGPGAGKGTQCDKLVNVFDFCHLSAGDLLRAEQQREGSRYGELIRTYIREGNIVPMEVTIKLLENAMDAALKEGRKGDGWADGKGRFLIDGFPRKMDQAVKFDEEVCMSSLVIFYQTTEEVMLKRLLKRGETSGREDDNVESIKKRFNTYKETTMPVINYYEEQGKVVEIDSTYSVEEVQQETQKVVQKLIVAQVTPAS